ncbi:MAG: hypothetical protein KI791_14365 [Cyclobacteriaceae bacterium]|nr:hypothetical protein [Cyclobacteriaceae bacterium SS2]
MKDKILLLVLLIPIVFWSCQSQDRNTCNRETYGTKKYVDNFPEYLCIPDGFVIDDFIRTSDLNYDGVEDFLCVKYNKREEDQIDGDMTYWDFYKKEPDDSIYFLYKTLNNLVPPFLKEQNFEYLTSHEQAGHIFETYPRRMMNNKLSLEINLDTLRLRYKLDDTYGKSFVFVYNKADLNWRLCLIEYFLGELPLYWWENDDFYYPLKDTIKIIETRLPNERILIDQFNLQEAYKFNEEENFHLSDYHVNKINQDPHNTILTLDFKTCDGFTLPSEWKY